MINLYLLGEKGYHSLGTLDNSYHSLINTIVVGNDRNVVNDYSTETIEYCKANRLNYIIQNKTIENSTSIYSIAIGWRWLINDQTKLIVFHDSILPQLRGFNPLVTALINGKSEIGLSVLFGTEEFDKGEIIIQKKIQIAYPIKINTAIQQVSLLYGEALNELFQLILGNSIESTAQDDSSATYSLWRDDDDYRINWSKSSDYINRFIDAVGYPYKGAYTILNDRKVHIRDSYVIDDVVIENRVPGKVLFKKGNKYCIVCGSGLLCVEDFFDANGEKIEITKFRLRFI